MPGLINPFPGLTGARPHFESAGASVWLLEPTGLAIVLRGRITRADARLVGGPATEAALARAHHAPYDCWYDARGVEAYEAGARLDFVATGRRLGRKRLGRIEVLVGKQSGLVRMGITVAVSAMTVAGISCHVHSNVSEMLAAGSNSLTPARLAKAG